jgi:hypothetical protein
VRHSVDGFSRLGELLPASVSRAAPYAQALRRAPNEPSFDYTGARNAGLLPWQSYCDRNPVTGLMVLRQGEVLIENVLRAIDGLPALPAFDGHANCFIESGDGKAMLLVAHEISGTLAIYQVNAICDGAGDINADCIVDANDLGALLAAWGPCAAPCAADLNGDGSVGGDDLALGQCERRLAEPAGQAEVLRRRQRLVAEEQHSMLEPGAAQRGYDPGRLVVPQVDAVHLRPQRAGDAAHVERQSLVHRPRPPVAAAVS